MRKNFQLLVSKVKPGDPDDKVWIATGDDESVSLVYGFGKSDTFTASDADNALRQVTMAARKFRFSVTPVADSPNFIVDFFGQKEKSTYDTHDFSFWQMEDDEEIYSEIEEIHHCLRDPIVLYLRCDHSDVYGRIHVYPDKIDGSIGYSYGEPWDIAEWAGLLDDCGQWILEQTSYEEFVTNLSYSGHLQTYGYDVTWEHRYRNPQEIMEFLLYWRDYVAETSEKNLNDYIQGLKDYENDV